MPRDFGFKEKVVHAAAEIWPVDFVLQKRAEWFLENSGIERHLKSGGQYLDVGTGKGHITQRILADMEKAGTPLKGYYGIDIADKPLNKVQKRESKRRKTPLAENENPMGFVWATSDALPFKDGSLDGVSYIFSIHHMDKETMDRVLQEAKRVIKKNGNIFIAEDLVDTKDKEQRQITEERDRLLNLESKDEEHNYKGDQEWKEYFESIGLEVTANEFFDSQTKKGPIHHGFYTLQLKQETE